MRSDYRLFYVKDNPLRTNLLLLVSRAIALAPILLVWSIFFFVDSASLLTSLCLSIPALMVGTVYMIMIEDL